MHESVAELVDGVFEIECTERLGRLRAHLFADDAVLFDTGLAGTTDALFAGIDTVGVAPEHVVITHEDPDHVGGLAAVVERYEPTVWVPAPARDAVDVDADEYFADGDDVRGFEAVYVPGHTEGASALIDESRSVAVLGDVVVGGAWRGLPSGTLVPPPAVYSEDLNRAEASLDALLAYDFEVGLVSHGSSALGGASGKLDAFLNFPGRPE